MRLDLQIKFEVRGHTHTVLLLFDSAFKSLYLSKTEGKTGLNTRGLTNKATTAGGGKSQPEKQYEDEPTK